VDKGEEVLTAAVREAREEVGIEIRVDRLLNVYSYPGSAPVIIVYVATMVGGELACDEEGLEVKWFPPDTIPWGDLAFQSTIDALREFLGVTR
jgi:8-oxo-dGTP pyrophosphatase MutT (NUDIX family)